MADRPTAERRAGLQATRRGEPHVQQEEAQGALEDGVHEGVELGHTLLAGDQADGEAADEQQQRPLQKTSCSVRPRVAEGAAPETLHARSKAARMAGVSMSASTAAI